MNSVDQAIHEHYKLIRESPAYRNFLMLEEMRAEMQPPLYSEPKSELKPLITPLPLWTNKQWDIIEKLRVDNYTLSKKLFKALNLITASKKTSREGTDYL